MSRNDVYAQIGTAFSWAGTAQASWNGDHTMVNCSDFFTYIKSDGSSCTTLYGTNGAHQIMNWSQMQQHAVNSTPVSHTPILSNNTFAGAVFSPWTADGSATCSANFAASTTDQEGTDGGSATGNSSNGTCTIGMSQTFNVTAAPTSQSLSFYYETPNVSAGDGINCTAGTGSATITIKLNGTTISTITNPTYDSSWHPVSTPISAMVSGSNTLDITVSLTAASGTTGSPACTTHQYAQQHVYIDNVQLTATY